MYCVASNTFPPKKDQTYHKVGVVPSKIIQSDASMFA